MKNCEIDMCHGPLFGKIVLFSLPLMVTCILQLLFNAADLVIIGHCADRNCLAAIGCAMSMNGLVLDLFGGLSAGANVIDAQIFGENRPEKMKSVVDTAMILAFVGGIFLMFAGLAIAKPLLVLMKTPEEILTLSCTYNAEKKRLYVHIMDYPVKFIHLPKLAGKVRFARLLGDHSEIKTSLPSAQHASMSPILPPDTLNLILPSLKPDDQVPVAELFL